MIRLPDEERWVDRKSRDDSSVHHRNGVFSVLDLSDFRLALIRFVEHLEDQLKEHVPDDPEDDEHQDDLDALYKRGFRRYF